MVFVRWRNHHKGGNYKQVPVGVANDINDKSAAGVLTFEQAVRTAREKVKGKIAIDGMYRTEEERRKLENRAAAVKVAVDELNERPAQQDATKEIDDDWLNLYAKLAEDKSSEELRSLFGKILAGEIRRPGSFSLRAMHFVAALSRTGVSAHTHDAWSVAISFDRAQLLFIWCQ